MFDSYMKVEVFLYLSMQFFQTPNVNLLSYNIFVGISPFLNKE